MWRLGIQRREELSAGSLCCSNDFVEALIAAQIIPARIQEEIAVCGASRDLRDNFEFLERARSLARPRVNERERGGNLRTLQRVFGNWPKLDRAPCLADRLFLSTKPSINCCDLREVSIILDLGLPLRVQPFPRG